MEIKGDYVIEADQQTVWDALNDPDVLAQVIPGCESIIQESDTELDATVTAKVGPVKAKFKGRVTLSEVQPPESYVLTGEGKGGAAGFAKGSAHVQLEPIDDQSTQLRYTVTANVGGKLAQIGQRYIDSTATKFADDFFSKFSDLAKARAAGDAIPAPETAETPNESSAEPVLEAGAPVAEVASSPAPASAPDAAPQSAPGGLSPWVWIAGLTIVIAALVALAGRMPH